MVRYSIPFIVTPSAIIGCFNGIIAITETIKLVLYSVMSSIVRLIFNTQKKDIEGSCLGIKFSWSACMQLVYLLSCPLNQKNRGSLLMVPFVT
jgi:hypothetical protein